MKRLVIYHGNCADGFTAAWVARKYFLEIQDMLGLDGFPEFFAAVYGEAPPDVKDKTVYIVDFSYKSEVMKQIISEANRVVVLDHHQTAEADLKILEGQYALERYECTFDMKRSGAMIAWNYFYPDIDPPYMLERVQDRDLWKFKFDDTRPLNSYLFSKEYTWENWDKLMAKLNEESLIITMWVAQGKAIDEKHLKDIKELLKVCTRPMEFLESRDEHGNSEYVRIPVVNLPYTMGSDAASILAKENDPPVAAYYYDTPEGRNFGFRSIGDYDCSILAKYLGGGGHKNAAGANKIKAYIYQGMEVGIDIKGVLGSELPMKVYPHVEMGV